MNHSQIFKTDDLQKNFAYFIISNWQQYLSKPLSSSFIFKRNSPEFINFPILILIVQIDLSENFAILLIPRLIENDLVMELEQCLKY